LKRLSRVAASFKITPHYLGLPRKIAGNDAGPALWKGGFVLMLLLSKELA